MTIRVPPKSQFSRTPANSAEPHFDSLSPEQRSERMRRIRAKDTKPEIIVRRLAWSLGYRYRLHCRKLPGCPDLVFTARKKVIFIHGCFWHQHKGCNQYRMPRSRLEFWLPKLESNKERDRANSVKLKKKGWSVLILWECELKKRARVTRRITSFMEAE